MPKQTDCQAGFIRRRFGRGTNDYHGKGRIANHNYRHTQQNSIPQYLSFLLRHKDTPKQKSQQSHYKNNIPLLNGNAARSQQQINHPDILEPKE